MTESGLGDNATVDWPLRWSRLCLALVLVAFVALWVGHNRGMLFDPDLQADDARNQLPVFHRYSDPPALVADQYARQGLAIAPLGFFLLMRSLTPWFGVLVAAKVVQALAFGTLVLSAVLVAWSRRGGLAPAALLVFLFLHTAFVVGRIAGGLPRAFAFPLLALWLAGALRRSRPIRFAAALGGALTYPPAMVLLLATEGLWVFLEPPCALGAGGSRKVVTRYGPRLVAFVLLVVACAAVVIVYLQTYGGRAGRPPTLAEAEADPAFWRDGRLRVLPFQDPFQAFPQRFLEPLRPIRAHAGTPLARALDPFFAVGVIVLLIGLVVARRTAVPWPAVALFLASTSTYILARLFAFSLYAPSRYRDYGVVAASVVTVVCGFGLAFARVRPRNRRQALRNFTVAAVIVVVALVLGLGSGPNTGMRICRRNASALYDCVARLPSDVRIGAHPMDSDDIPLWSARSTTVGFERLTPWFTDSWKDAKEEAEDAISAFYATDWERVLEFCRNRNLTHLLVNRRRYGPDFYRRADMVEPFRSYTRELLRGVRQTDFVLKHVPESAVVFSRNPFVLVSVDALEQTLGQVENR